MPAKKIFLKEAVRTANVFGLIELIDVSLLKPHEQTNSRTLSEVIDSIQKEKTLFFPVVIEKPNLVILDGHHRVEAFRLMGIKKIPCFIVDYNSNEIKLFNRRKEFNATKKEVIRRALTEQLFPEKTTLHVLELFRINYKIGGAEMHKINEIKKIGNKIMNGITQTKTITGEEKRLWRHIFGY